MQTVSASQQAFSWKWFGWPGWPGPICEGSIVTVEIRCDRRIPRPLPPPAVLSLSHAHPPTRPDPFLHRGLFERCDSLRIGRSLPPWCVGGGASPSRVTSRPASANAIGPPSWLSSPTRRPMPASAAASALLMRGNARIISRPAFRPPQGYPDSRTTPGSKPRWAHASGRSSGTRPHTTGYRRFR